MRRMFLSVLIVALACRPVRSAEPPRADVDKSFPLPILTVTAGAVGRCDRPMFTFLRRAADRTPLSLAISEDVPGGAGDSIRASVWQAAMVAALDRMDPLSGVRISLDVSGPADGPSGGAAICLAILSALDGREFPQDCAVTGAIMPDGTIGGVGGIAVKLRAAAQVGIRRVCIPTYLRFEKQGEGGEEVDLKRLAAQLKIDLVPVENVAQAYAAIHGLAVVPQPVPDRSVLELPEVTEEVLKNRYQTHRQAGLKVWNGMEEAERERLSKDPVFGPMFIDDLSYAENAYRTGRLCVAANSVWMWHEALEGYRSLAATNVKDLEKPDLAATAREFKAAVTKTMGEMPPSSTLLKPIPKTSEASAQLYVDLYNLAGTAGAIELVQEKIDSYLAAAAQPELKPEEWEAVRKEVNALGLVQLFVAHGAVRSAKNWHGEIGPSAATLPLRPVCDDAQAIERLFFSASSASRNTFRYDVVGALSEKLQVSQSQALTALRPHDLTLVMHEAALDDVQSAHERALAQTDPIERRFALAVSAHLQAECLATQIALISRWHQLDVSIGDDGAIGYGRTDLLNYLITSARENALRALGECRKAGLVPIAPISHFEEADMSRDDVTSDKVDVLAEYWHASLQAKVLLMLYGSTKDLPVPAKSSAASETPAPPTVKATGSRAASSAATPLRPAAQPILGLDRPAPFGLNPPSSLPGAPRNYSLPSPARPMAPYLNRRGGSSGGGGSWPRDSGDVILAVIAVILYGVVLKWLGGLGRPKP
jgi:hypothetical protein